MKESDNLFSFFLSYLFIGLVALAFGLFLLSFTKYESKIKYFADVTEIVDFPSEKDTHKEEYENGIDFFKTCLKINSLTLYFTRKYTSFPTLILSKLLDQFKDVLTHPPEG